MLEYLCAGVYFGTNRGDRQLSLVSPCTDGASNADSVQGVEALNMMMLRRLPGTGSLSQVQLHSRGPRYWWLR